MIYHFDITASTNDDARDEKYREGDVVWADFQTAGRGQRGHEWHSRKGENLTFSAVLEPLFVPIAEQFSVSEVVALSLVDMLAEYGIEARIKWTNDIYVGDKKLVGILIEHSLASTSLRRTIVGIGINVNQKEFDSALPNPVSMTQLLGKEFDLERVLECFCRTCNATMSCCVRAQRQHYTSDIIRCSIARTSITHTPCRVAKGLRLKLSAQPLRAHFVLRMNAVREKIICSKRWSL